jgi:N-acetylmuramoyl-L-alanine amidase
MKNLFYFFILILLILIPSCKEGPQGYYRETTELDSLFDFEDPEVIKAYTRIDSILNQDSISNEDLNLLDSLNKAVRHDSLFSALDEAEALQGQPLKRLVIHCTASNIKNPHTKESLLAFFKNYNKWSKPGYTFFIDRQGIIWKLNNSWDWDPIVNYSELTFGAAGYNSTSLHCAWDGGLDNNKIVDNRTIEQKIALRTFVSLAIDIYPNIEVMGHRDLPNVHKACPIFDVKKEYKNILLKK